jgi:hypothetical protein
MIVLTRLLVASAVALALVNQTMAEESVEQTIDYLLRRIETSKATFIRNGKEHTLAEAVSHIKDKYDHFKGEIKTPEDFIRLSASKSLLTGRPYLVRTLEGKEMHLDAWLTGALEEHRAQTRQ